jgi:tetratricopeptide (TPR) repeat protein
MRRTMALFALLAAAALAGAETATRDSEHYRLTTDMTGAIVDTTLAKLEGAYTLFAGVFHFVPADKMRATLFGDKKSFDDYVASVIKETRTDFVYIHYADAAKSELVAWAMPDERQFDASLLHQACIQFLKGAVPNPPVWIREGTAAYFERSAFNAETGRVQFKPDLAWLESLKAAVASPKAVPVARLILLDNEAARAQIQTFYPQAWALVSLLLESQDADLNRIYWDSLCAMDPAMSVADNSARVRERAFAWYDEAKLERAYKEYVDGLKGFNELVAEGTDLYARQQYDKAEDAFVHAMRTEPENYVPYYYLGLVKYATGDYRSAEVLFKSALDLGADPGVTKYALGVNAFAGNSYEQSRAWLLEARAANPKAYGEKVDSLLARMSTLR